MPAQPVALQPACKNISQLAQQGVKQDADQHHVGLQKLACVHGQVTNAGLRRDGFGHDQDDPHQAQRKAQADQDGRHRARQDDFAVQLPARQAVGAPHLNQAGVHIAYAVEGVDIDREKHRHRNQEQLGRLVDAKPQDHQRDQRQRGDVAHHLYGRVQQGFKKPHRAREQAKGQAQPAAYGQPGQRTACADLDVRPELTRFGQRPSRLDHLQRRRQHARREPAQRRSHLPQGDQANRHHPGQQALTQVAQEGGN